MKEFIYTCEHCGAEYKISEYGKYKCQKCNNSFVVKEEDPFSPTEEEIAEVEKRIQLKEQERKLKKIQQKSDGSQKTKFENDDTKQVVNKEGNQNNKQKNKYYGEEASSMMFFMVIISGVIAFFSFVSAASAAGRDDVASSFIGTCVCVAGITDAIIIYIAYKFFGLFQRMEYHLRTMVKEDLDE